MRVKPPGRPSIMGTTVSKSFFTASASCSREAARRRALKSFLRARVTILSASCRATLAFWTVVWMDIALMRPTTSIGMRASRCDLDRPNLVFCFLWRMELAFCRA